MEKYYEEIAITPIINIMIPTHSFLLIALFLNKNFDNIKVTIIPNKSIALGIPGFGDKDIDVADVIV